MNHLKSSRKKTIIASSTLAAALLVGAGIGVTQAHHTVALEVDGVSREVSGFSRNVDGVLQAANVEVGEHDQVVPAPDAAVSDGTEITVTRAKAYTVNVDGKPVTAWSTAASSADVLEDIEASGRGAILAADRSQVRAALPAAATGAKVDVKADGAVKTVEATATDGANELLAKAGVTASPLDRVAFTKADDGTLTVDVTRVTRGERIAEQRTPFTEERVDDPEIEQGTEEVVQEGQDGVVNAVFYTQKVGDKTLVDAKVREDVVSEMKPKIIHVGTKEPAAATTASSGSADGAAAASAVGGDVWAQLAQCESGGNPTTNTGNGFYGMYQFTASTWASVGGSGLPSDASAEEQTMRAQILQQRAGWGQWPACTASMGLY